MKLGVAPLLEDHRIFSSRNADELRGFLESKDFRLEMDTGGTPHLDARFNGIYMPGMYLGYIQYGASVSVRATARDDYWLQMPVSGKLEVVDGKQSVVCDTRSAALASPTHNDYYLVKSNEDCGGVRLCFYKSALMSCLAALLGTEPSAPLAFETEMDLREGHGYSLAQHILLAIQDLERRDHAGWTQATMTAFQNFVITALLTAQPHNFSEALKRLEVPVAPRDVKRAVDYIRANFSSPITVEDLVAVTGVPGRTLFKHFRDAMGLSPMEYLRRARFEQVRNRLLAADEEESVTAIALAAGFAHMGRFAQGYRERYGEMPSQTLKQRRLSAPAGAVQKSALSG